jgi:hypothetical protein
LSASARALLHAICVRPATPSISSLYAASGDAPAE